MKKVITLFAGALLLFTFTVKAGPKWFVAPEVKTAPNLEQGLDDPIWDKALKIPFSKLEDGPGNSSKYLTTSYWLRSGNTLFVGFDCVNSNSPELFAPPKQLRDYPAYTKEGVELFVGDSDGDLYYQLVVDAQGNIFDGKRFNARWNGDWKRSVKRFPGHWTVIYEIPAPILTSVWKPGSPITVDVTRHGFTPDGSKGETTTISPPGVHSPEDKIFLGVPNPAALGDKLSATIGQFKRQFANTKLSENTIDKLADLTVFAAECRQAGNVDLAKYRNFHTRCIQAKKDLRRLEKNLVLTFIFRQE